MQKVTAITLPAAADAEMPDELDSRHLFKRLLQLSLLVALVVAAVFLLPGLSSVRSRIAHASAGWLVGAGALELFSALSYVVVFRAVFCARMSWRFSYQVGMAEQAANSLLPAGGAGGLALGAWALRRGGMSADNIARRTVAFFILTSLANLGTLIVFGVAFPLGIFGRDRAPAVTIGFAAAAVLGIVIVLWLPALATRLGAGTGPLPTGTGRAKRIAHRSLGALGDGVHDAESLLRHRPAGVLTGSWGYMGFDIATLGVCFLAFGYTPGLGVLVVGYIIGQLGGLLPIPGGIGGTEGGLIGAFTLYHVPLSASATAVLTYRAFQLWLPAVLGSIAFVQLRRSLRKHDDPAALCEPLSEPIPALATAAPGPPQNPTR